jgi:K+ transporter
MRPRHVGRSEYRLRRAPAGSLFVVMSRNARSATEFFGIPPNRVVEMGAQVEM